MTRKDFELIAQVLSEVSDLPYRQQIAKNFADKLANTNPRFDRERFLAACIRD
jgi:hypothetical protein